MGKKLVTDEQIKEMHKRIEKGEDTDSIVKEFGISRQAYSLRLKKLNMVAKPKTRTKKIESINIDKLKDISDIYELAALLNLSFDEVHNISKNPKGTESESKRLNYLKNHNPEKFKDEVCLLIIKYFKISPLSLFKLLNKETK